MTCSSKHTIQRLTDGSFESVVRDVYGNYQDVDHHVELSDALLAKIVLFGCRQGAREVEAEFTCR